jgi:DNA-binding MarR family transcriptional regulator
MNVTKANMTGLNLRPEMDIDPGPSLTFLLVDVSRLFRSSFDKAIDRAGIDVTPGEARTLVHLADIGQCNQATLAARMSIEPMTMSNYLDRLVFRNLVSRAPDPSDRRSKIVCLSSGGKSVLRRIEPILGSVYNQAVAGIGSDDISYVYSRLNSIRTNLLANGEEAGG